MSTNILTESIELIEGTIDPETRRVDVVLIRPGWSANGRYYAPDVLARAVSLYEGRKAYADHPTKDMIRRGEGRSVRDITGMYTDVRIGESGELRATRHVYRTPAGDAVWPLIVETIQSKRQVIGLSINAVGRAAQGKGPDGRDGVIVEEITAVNSVDDVTEPAAGGGFEALIAGSDTLVQDVMNALTFEEFIAARPEFVERLKKEWKAARQDQAVAAALSERDQARNELIETRGQIDTLNEQIAAKEDDLASLRADLARKVLEVQLEQALRKASLPATWETDIREQLSKAEPTDWLGIVEREQRKAQQAGHRREVTVTGAGRREAAPLAEMTPAAPQVINMAIYDTPEKLKAYLESIGVR